MFRGSVFSFLLIFWTSAQAYQYAVDFSVVATTDQLNCLRTSYQVKAAFIQGYKADNNGSFDSNCVSNVNAALKANVLTELYMTISPQSSTKQGYIQVNEFEKALKKNGITVRRVWMKVTSDMNWYSDPILNQGMISQVLGRLRQNGYSVGILTNINDWNTLTNNWTQAGSDVYLWYSNVKGKGTNNETPATFDDFVPFGVATTPTIKQYGQQEQLCGIVVNRDCYN